MSLLEKIHQDIVTAAKQKDVVRRDTLRMVEAMLKNERIALQKDLDESAVEKVLARAVKSRKEAATEYEKVQQPERAQQELFEAEIISQYLPEQMTTEALTALVRQTIKEVGATSPAEMGKVMGKLMPQIQGKADGKVAQDLVRQLLI